MNIERMIQLCDFLKSLPNEQFDMSDVLSDYDRETGPTCKTVGCVAGWAYIMAVKTDPIRTAQLQEAEEASLSKVDQEYLEAFVIPCVAKNWLELTWAEADHLFLARWAPTSQIRDVTRAETIAHLGELIAMNHRRRQE